MEKLLKILAVATTMVLTSVASEVCLLILYQPEEPKGIKKFSKLEK